MFTKKRIIVLSFLCFVVLGSTAQQLPKGFVYITKKIPNVTLEMRYFGSDNFMGTPVDSYHKPVGIVSKKSARALKKVQKQLNKKGLGLKIFDAYRPQSAVNHFIKWAENLNDTINKAVYYPNVAKKNLFKEGYIAARSGHSRGSTLDLTIISLASQKELDMGSGWDFFGEPSWVAYDGINELQKKNRNLLQQVMLKNGFKNYDKEWWHFTLKNEPFPDHYFDFPIE